MSKWHTSSQTSPCVKTSGSTRAPCSACVQIINQAKLSTMTSASISVGQGSPDIRTQQNDLVSFRVRERSEDRQRDPSLHSGSGREPPQHCPVSYRVSILLVCKLRNRVSLCPLVLNEGGSNLIQVLLKKAGAARDSEVFSLCPFFLFFFGVPFPTLFTPLLPLPLLPTFHPLVQGVTAMSFHYYRTVHRLEIDIQRERKANSAYVYVFCMFKFRLSFQM